MDFISTVFGQLLGWLYGVTSNYAIAIIVFTVLVKLALIPLSISQIKQTKAMNEIQPKMKALQAKYKNDKEALNAKTMELYKEHNVNPLSGCLPILIQFPILIGLFKALREPLNYVFGGNAAVMNEALGAGFLWVTDLSLPDTLGTVLGVSEGLMATLPGILPIFAALTTYLQMATMSNKGQQNDQMKTMAMMMPLMILFMGRSFSAGLMIYWTVSNLFQMAQQHFINRLAKEEAK